jgi:hypothetical protein
MGKDVHGWIQTSYDGEVWLSVVNVGHVLRGVDAITSALIDEGGLFGGIGLPDDLQRDRAEPWVRTEFGLEHGYAHTWFDWDDFEAVLRGEVDESERVTYRGDPEYIVGLRARRMAVRDALAAVHADHPEWPLLVAIVKPLVAKFGPKGVRCVVWFTW